MSAEKTVVIGLTGGIGTGKSKVADLLEELGAAVECSDRIVRELQAPGGEALKQIVERFGPQVLTAQGELDRAALGDVVFSDAEARRDLGNIIHPLVYQELAARMGRHKAGGARVVVLDIPLLLEGKQSGRGSGAFLPFDHIVVVYADPDTQIERVMARDGLNQEDATARVLSQLSIDEKRQLADIVIENGGAWEETESRVRALFAEWAD